MSTPPRRPFANLRCHSRTHPTTKRGVSHRARHRIPYAGMASVAGVACRPFFSRACVGPTTRKPWSRYQERIAFPHERWATSEPSTIVPSPHLLSELFVSLIMDVAVCSAPWLASGGVCAYLGRQVVVSTPHGTQQVPHWDGAKNDLHAVIATMMLYHACTRMRWFAGLGSKLFWSLTWHG